MFIIFSSSASNKYNHKIHPAAPCTANTVCNSPGCNNLCVDENGKRNCHKSIDTKNKKKNQTHAPRCCAVCGVWYCGSCKRNGKMTKSIQYNTIQYNTRNSDGAPMPYMADCGSNMLCRN